MLKLHYEIKQRCEQEQEKSTKSHREQEMKGEVCPVINQAARCCPDNNLDDTLHAGV